MTEYCDAHCKEDPIYVFPEMKLRGRVPNFHIHVSVSDFYVYFHDWSTYFAAAN
jgi:hypothetical protein